MVPFYVERADALLEKYLKIGSDRLLPRVVLSNTFRRFCAAAGGGMEIKMKTLIVIDMQNDFITGALGTPEARAILPSVKKKIEEYSSRGDEIIFTRDTHGEDYLDTPEGRKLPVPHCIKGSDGWQVSAELYKDCSEIIDKPSFGYTGWGDRSFSEIELVGVCTDICVVSNALILKALYPDVKITVDGSCCAGVTPESHSAALITMSMCQIDVI